MSELIKEIRNLNLDRAELWINEAKFGAQHIKPYIQALPENSRILEVGCGSGILLSMLSEQFGAQRFYGIEPFGDGFDALKELNALIQQSGITIDMCGYETYQPQEKFDLIFCVNVFEHVDNWRHFLTWSAEMLTENGQFIVLCPNYSFPVETHFGLPIIGNKALTHKIFQNRINRFEYQKNVHGLWRSLNFVKKRHVKNFIKYHPELQLEFADNTTIIDDMVARFSNDPEFRQRQKILGGIAYGLQKVGLFKICKLFPNYLPYMKLKLRKHSAL